MKKLFILLLSFGIYACNVNTNTETKHKNILAVSSINSNNILWINDFRDFRNSIYNKNINKVKTFVNFKNTYSDSRVHIENGSEYFTFNDTISEKDFDKHYSRIFSEPFIKTILKIKSDMLLQTGNAETPFILINDTRYKMYADFDKIENTLHLNLYSETPINDAETVEGKAEFSIIYNFKIAANGKIKFVKLDVAG